MKLTPAACAFEAFGGVRETARVLGLTFGTVCRWQKTRGRFPKGLIPAGTVPLHHIPALVAEAAKRGKPLTTEHLVYGREPATQGVVTVRDGRKVEIRLHDTWQSMTNTLAMAEG